ncbi:MAG: acetate--CoA ligase family protein [Granulosicoccus sp.]|nr:acetate--CoA ligase family protein [Granulosicoccus sp.]
MSATRLARLFSPQSVAIVGGRVAESVVEEMQKIGFEGDIWPVNPKRADMGGIPCFPSLDALPAAPDAAYLGIHRDASVEAIATLSAMGTGGVICHASGFAEMGNEGKTKSAALIKAAGDMPVVGPNCWGLLNLMDKAAMWPDFHGAIPVKSGVAIVNQSGNMALNYTMQKRGLDIALVVTLGNQAMIDANDCIEVFLADERIRAIGLHVEGLNDLPRFSKLAILARNMGKPIVAFKTGVSEKGAYATVSHTATLSGSDDLYDALFKRYGIARVHSIPVFLETLKMLSVIGTPSGNSLATLSCSGGEVSLVADSVANRNLSLPDLTQEHAERVKATVNEFVDVRNPLDYHTFIWAQREAMTATFGAMMSGGFDLTALILDYPRSDRSRYEEYDIAIDAWIDATRKTDAKTAIVATLPECMPEEIAIKLAQQGIVPFLGVEEALDAFAAAQVSHGETILPLASQHLQSESTRTLDEAESKSLLAEFGLPIANGKVVPADEAVNIAGKITFPVVVKVTGIAHKTESDGIRLNLRNVDQLKQAVSELSAISDRLLVEEMTQDAICELIIGVHRDPQFGLALVIGAGGVLTELIADSTSLLLPTQRAEIDRALASLKVNRLLTGFRGKHADRDAVIHVIEQVAEFANTFHDTLHELDINPLIVSQQGKGVTIVDAFIRKS